MPSGSGAFGTDHSVAADGDADVRSPAQRCCCRSQHTDFAGLTQSSLRILPMPRFFVNKALLLSPNRSR